MPLTVPQIVERLTLSLEWPRVWTQESVASLTRLEQQSSPGALHLLSLGGELRVCGCQGGELRVCSIG